MKLQTDISLAGRELPRGFTLIELVVSVGLGVVVFGVIVALTIFTAKSFLAATNYVSMDDQSRNALDQISREVRNSSALLSFSTNNPQSMLLTNATLGVTSTITCDTNAGTLMLAKTGQPTQILLTGCYAFSFQLFDRYPTTTLSFYGSTNFLTGQLSAQFCKVINMQWKCYRTILGSKLNTEIVQTAQVVLRNQVSE
jgi:type II secretory pathway pseudopilin PulG